MTQILRSRHLSMKDGISTFSHMHLPFTNRRIQFLCQKSPYEGRKSAWFSIKMSQNVILCKKKCQFLYRTVQVTLCIYHTARRVIIFYIGYYLMLIQHVYWRWVRIIVLFSCYTKAVLSDNDFAYFHTTFKAITTVLMLCPTTNFYVFCRKCWKYSDIM